MTVINNHVRLRFPLRTPKPSLTRNRTIYVEFMLRYRRNFTIRKKIQQRNNRIMSLRFLHRYFYEHNGIVRCIVLLYRWRSVNFRKFIARTKKPGLLYERKQKPQQVHAIVANGANCSFILDNPALYYARQNWMGV